MSLLIETVNGILQEVQKKQKSVERLSIHGWHPFGTTSNVRTAGQGARSIRLLASENLPRVLVHEQLIPPVHGSLPASP